MPIVSTRYQTRFLKLQTICISREVFLLLCCLLLALSDLSTFNLSMHAAGLHILDIYVRRGLLAAVREMLSITSYADGLHLAMISARSFIIISFIKREYSIYFILTCKFFNTLSQIDILTD